ncbi:uncharacterized protein LOC119030772 isoform X1 [Acanthopagrus latus]|uniref:uncharacterized protein LOC119030772 isoform X1 n=1 Tax=Acanthopagrus latus TaxID=8177 RepID=UPI00187C55C8|nr:uncharacterized protein LOC119030772 isoform X1 [Acanthopagrus latus]
MRQETEQVKLDLERQKLALVREGKVAGDVVTDGISGPGGTPVRSDFGDFKLVPKFNERDPETFFLLFERLAEARGWSESTCTLMLQCVLTGRAQEAYSCLSSSDSVKYDVVKSAVLKVYELVPEAYRQRFRGWRRGDKSHLEFALSWCRSSMLTVPSRVCWTWCGLLGSFKDPVAEAVGERKIVGDISGEVFSIIAVISIVLGV